MIASIFITLSVKINKSISENKKIENKIKNNLNIKNKIKKWEKDVIKIDDNTSIFITWKNYFKVWLKKNENIKLNIDSKTNIILDIKEGSLIKYKTWVTENIITKKTSFLTNTWEILEITNMWWFSNIEIFSEKDIVFPYKKYKVIQKIWNKEIEKETWELK